MSTIKEEVVNNILKPSKSEKLFLKALSVYKISKENWVEKTVIFILCTIISIILAASPSTVSLVENSVSILLTVFLTLFGIVFMGYTIFQALLSNRLIINLFENTEYDKKQIEKSKLQEANENFVYLMMLFILGIIINIILCIVIPVIPIYFCLFENIKLCTFIAAIFIDILLYFMGVIIWRMVSFVGNIFHLFNAYSVAKLIEALKEEE